MCETGGAHQIIKKYARLWEICIDHFDPYAAVRGPGRRDRTPLEEILVEHSTFSRKHVKTRLYEAGVKHPICELCGQDEIWHGKVMGMILDHVNGVNDDHRLENLRIVCPNCAATLDTHCARGRRVTRVHQDCVRCGNQFRPKSPTQRYCSRECGIRWDGRESRDRVPVGWTDRRTLSCCAKPEPSVSRQPGVVTGLPATPSGNGSARTSGAWTRPKGQADSTPPILAEWPRCRLEKRRTVSAARTNGEGDKR